MQPNIAMKFAITESFFARTENLAKKYYNFRDIEFFLGDYFFGAPCMFNPTKPTVAIGYSYKSILCQTGLSRHSNV